MRNFRLVPKRKVGAARREEIIRAAIRRLARDGYSGVTLRTLAADADLNQGLLHHYFRTRAVTAKRSILHAALNSTVAGIKRLCQTGSAAGDAQAELRVLIHRLLEVDRDTRLVQLQFLSAIMQDRDVRKITADAYHDLRRSIGGIVGRMKRRAPFRRVNPREASFIILGLIEGVAIQRTLDPGVVSGPEASRRCLEAVTDYLIGRGQSRSKPAMVALRPKRGTLQK